MHQIEVFGFGWGLGDFAVDVAIFLHGNSRDLQKA